MMIGFYATLFDKFGAGLHWNTWIGVNKSFCRKNWWTNLLYVNNYVNVEDMVSWLRRLDSKFVNVYTFFRNLCYYYLLCQVRKSVLLKNK